MGRRVASDLASLEQQPGESFHDCVNRMHDTPEWLRAQADRAATHPSWRTRRHCAVYLLDRAERIEAGEAVEWFNYAKATGIRAV